MYLGDNLLRNGLVDLVEAFRASEPEALILLTQVNDPESYGVAELDGERVVRLVEKPKDPPSDLALVGVYMFGPEIFAAAKSIEPSARGELEITDAIDALIDGGKRVEPHIVRGWWKDTGRLEDMLEANRLVLEDLEERFDGELVDSEVEGKVVIEKGAKLERSTVRGTGDHRRGGPHHRLLRRALHGDRPRRRHRRLGDRALDRARGLADPRPAGAHGGEPAGQGGHPRAQPGDAQDDALPGRGQRRHRDPVSGVPR